MKTKKRYVDVLSPKLKYEDNVPANERKKFEDILSFMNGLEYRFNSEKIFQFVILSTLIPDCIVGMIITNQDRDIPPKMDKRTKQFSPVNINPDTEGLAFGNVFIYDKRRNIFIYEINRNGCYPNQLIEFIYKQWNAVAVNVHFDLKFIAVARAHEYTRMLSMHYYKRISVELYNPTEIVNCFANEIDSVENRLIKAQIQAGINANADTVRLEQIAVNKRVNPMGLSKTEVVGLTDTVKLCLADRGYRKNIQKLEVEGYSLDPENPRSASKSIDLLTDTFNESFLIPDIRIQVNVQEAERKIGIENVYNRLLPELKTIIGF
jgi:hypothetical protein